MILIGKDCKSVVYMKDIGNKYGGVDEIYVYTFKDLLSVCCVCMCVLVCM